MSKDLETACHLSENALIRLWDGSLTCAGLSMVAIICLSIIDGLLVLGPLDRYRPLMHRSVGISLYWGHPRRFCLLFLLSHRLLNLVLCLAYKVNQRVNFFEILGHCVVLFNDAFRSHFSSQTRYNLKFLLSIKNLKSFLFPDFSRYIQVLCQKGTFRDSPLYQSHEEKWSKRLLIWNYCVFILMRGCIEIEIFVKEVVTVINDKRLVFLRMDQLKFIF